MTAATDLDQIINHLTPGEINRIMEKHFQPVYDLEPVEKASLADLDEKVLAAFIQRVRDLYPRVFGQLADEVLLIQLGALTKVGKKICPTLGGLLTFGRFPQQHFPRLEIVFSVYAGKDAQTGSVCLTSKTIIGPIPDMLLEALELIGHHMAVGAMVVGALRKDLPDYSLAAVRHALINALQHRDYSREARGIPVQLNMYSDRLEVVSPGGLFGSVPVEMLGTDKVHFVRNEYLSRLLSHTVLGDKPVIANRGSGLSTMQSALKFEGMPTMEIQSTPSFFRVTFRKNKPEIFRRNWKNFDQALREELQSGKPDIAPKELVGKSGLSRSMIAIHLRRLLKEGVIEATQPGRNPNKRYRLANSKQKSA